MEKSPVPTAQIIFCPGCSSPEAYCLSDGRYKCKQCKKKFTPNRKKSRVPEETVLLIARGFWELKTAEQCAHELGINRKTAQSYYSKIRRNIAMQNDEGLKSLHIKAAIETATSEQDKHPVFWFLVHHGTIHVVFPEGLNFSLHEEDLPDTQGISQIYTDSLMAKNNIILDKFYRRTLWARKETDEKKLQEFWRYSKINLMRYRGGSKSRFPLFITEMAFRFNHQESGDAICLLEKILSSTSSNTQTESFGR